MKINIDYIEALNQLFESKYPNKGFFILKVNIDQHKVVKAFRTCSLSLYHHYKNNNNIFIQTATSGKVLNGDTSQLLEDAHMEMLKEIFLNINKIDELGSKSVSDTN